LDVLIISLLINPFANALVCLEGHDLLAIVKEHDDTRVSRGSLSLLFVMTGMV
jgi:hypothetical protein